MSFKKTYFVLLWLLTRLFIFAQSDSTIYKLTIFGNIYPAFSSTYGSKQRTFNSFEMNTAQVGFKTAINKNVKAVLLYNVTKTTSNIVVLDSSKKPMTVNYFKGSDFTAFLKEADITWTPHQHLELTVGQILSEQFLTTQDKFWNSRYITFTMQEKFNFGYPADFGFRAAYVSQKIQISVTISNGDGPFYKQDEKGFLMYAFNIEYKPDEHWIFKYYSSIYPNNSIYRWCHSLFIGYKKDNVRIGTEAGYVENDKWIETNDYKGLSAYVLFKLKPQWSLILREDFLIKTAVYSNASFSIAGVEYELNPYLKFSINQRLLNQNSYNIWQSYVSVGYRF